MPKGTTATKAKKAGAASAGEHPVVTDWPAGAGAMADVAHAHDPDMRYLVELEGRHFASGDACEPVTRAGITLEGCRYNDDCSSSMGEVPREHLDRAIDAILVDGAPARIVRERTIEIHNSAHAQQHYLNLQAADNARRMLEEIIQTHGASMVFEVLRALRRVNPRSEYPTQLRTARMDDLATHRPTPERAIEFMTKVGVATTRAMGGKATPAEIEASVRETAASRRDDC